MNAEINKQKIFNAGQKEISPFDLTSAGTNKQKSMNLEKCFGILALHSIES